MSNLGEWYFEIGVERGLAQITEQGRAEEHQRIQSANAKRLFAKGFPIPRIAELLDENVEQIRKWLS